ncbi:MAG TPA: DnaJ domain-containing protein [Rhodocyclaceae bacterium]|nr:DnaJ domain-containing protein [Rhodocyclaceae bacterium]
MAGSLYDILELSQSASPEAIASAFQRLKNQITNSNLSDEDRTNRLIALREAHATLSDPGLRARYDKKLSGAINAVYVETAPQRSWLKPVFLALLIGGSAIAYARYNSAQEAARLERERVAAEVRKAELAAKQAEQERLAEMEVARQRATEARMQQFDFEHTARYADQTVRMAQAQERSAAYAEAQAERQRRAEAERQVAKDKALLRQMQMENSAGGRYKY